MLVERLHQTDPYEIRLRLNADLSLAVFSKDTQTWQSLSCKGRTVDEMLARCIVMVAPKASVYIECDQCPTLDWSGTGLLLMLKNHLRSITDQLYLTGCSVDLKKAIRLARLDLYFQIQ